MSGNLFAIGGVLLFIVAAVWIVFPPGGRRG
jgi:hypothetical protein